MQKSLSLRIANRLLRSLGQRIQPLAAASDSVGQRRAETQLPEDVSAEVGRVLRILRYTKASGSSYNAEDFEAGYHTITLDGRTFKGQRHPGDRLSLVPFDFTGKRVLDIGCNQGGMLFATADRLSHGIGIDFDSRMINAANRIRSLTGTTNLDFYSFNLEQEDLGFIEDLLPDGRVDIVFLLSVCMWIKNWREVIDFASRLADCLLFESNGSLAQLGEQEDHLRQVFREVQRLSEASEDDPIQKQRKLYLCRR